MPTDDGNDSVSTFAYSRQARPSFDRHKQLVKSSVQLCILGSVFSL